jgi:Ca2+-binding RTX toxin-like protein
MLVVRFGRRSRVLVGSSAVAICLTGAAPALAVRAAASDGLAAQLLRLDPGARNGGNTQVASAAEATLVGAPGRVNFMIGLGPRQRIMGGARHDQLGARGAGALVRGGRGNDLIHGHRGRQMLAGGRGHDHIFGGPGRDRLHGGPGNDRLVDHQGATLVITGPGLNRVDVADGDGDERVLCTPGSINRIRADRSDRLHPRCRRATSSISYARRASKAPAARVAQQQPVSGAGTHDSPYIAACDDETQNPCEISAFAARSLTGVWANEYVPAYKCPTSHPYLYDYKYAPSGTHLLGGVEVVGLGPIGVSVTGFFSINLDTVWRITGADTGWPNSSATNWTSGTNSYHVKLHCTKTASLGFGGPRA